MKKGMCVVGRGLSFLFGAKNKGQQVVYTAYECVL